MKKITKSIKSNDKIMNINISEIYNNLNHSKDINCKHIYINYSEQSNGLYNFMEDKNQYLNTKINIYLYLNNKIIHTITIYIDSDQIFNKLIIFLTSFEMSHQSKINIDDINNIIKFNNINDYVIYH